MKVHITDGEQYPWLHLDAPGKWGGTDRERDWYDLPDDVVKRYRAACDEWEAAQEAVYAAMETAPKGGHPARFAYPQSVGILVDSVPVNLTPEQLAAAVGRLDAMLAADPYVRMDFAAVHEVVLDLGIVKGPAPDRLEP